MWDCAEVCFAYTECALICRIHVPPCVPSFFSTHYVLICIIGLLRRWGRGVGSAQFSGRGCALGFGPPVCLGVRPSGVRFVECQQRNIHGMRPYVNSSKPARFIQKCICDLVTVVVSCIRGLMAPFATERCAPALRTMSPRWFCFRHDRAVRASTANDVSSLGYALGMTERCAPALRTMSPRWAML